MTVKLYEKYLTSSLLFLWSMWLLRSFSILFSFRSFPLFQVFQSLSWSFILFFFQLCSGRSCFYYLVGSSIMPLMSLFWGVSMCRQSIAMILFYLKSVVSCLIHSNSCSLHGSSGPRRK